MTNSTTESREVVNTGAGPPPKSAEMRAGTVWTHQKT